MYILMMESMSTASSSPWRTTVCQPLMIRTTYQQLPQRLTIPKKDISLVLVDMDMPFAHIWHSIGMIKQWCQPRQTPIIALVDSNNPIPYARYLATRCTSFMYKPIDILDLHTLIACSYTHHDSIHII